MVITFFEFILYSLAVFRLTRLIVFDQIFEFIRAPFMMESEEMDENGEMEVYIVPRKSGIRGFIGQLISCYWCTGIWAAFAIVIILYFFPVVGHWCVVILAIAGAAALIESINQKLIQNN